MDSQVSSKIARELQNIFINFFFCFQPQSDGRLIDLVDNDWRNDKLPDEDIQLPVDKLPDPENDTENQISLKEQVIQNYYL